MNPPARNHNQWSFANRPVACQGMCRENPKCAYFVWDFGNKCFLKAERGTPLVHADPAGFFGPKYCGKFVLIVTNWRLL